MNKSIFLFALVLVVLVLGVNATQQRAASPLTNLQSKVKSSMLTDNDKFCNRPDGCDMWCGIACVSASCSGSTLYKGDGCYCYSSTLADGQAYSDLELCTVVATSKGPYCCD